jgi:hypothetical protein
MTARSNYSQQANETFHMHWNVAEASSQILSLQLPASSRTPPHKKFAYEFAMFPFCGSFVSVALVIEINDNFLLLYSSLTINDQLQSSSLRQKRD